MNRFNPCKQYALDTSGVILPKRNNRKRTNDRHIQEVMGKDGKMKLINHNQYRNIALGVR